MSWFRRSSAAAARDSSLAVDAAAAVPDPKCSAQLQPGNTVAVSLEAEVGVPASALFRLLANPDEHERIFSAIEGATSTLLEEDGPRRRYRLDYRARWSFWRVSGVCDNRLIMETDSDEGTVTFRLREPGFLRVYEGCWRLVPKGAQALNLGRPTLSAPASPGPDGLPSPGATPPSWVPGLSAPRRAHHHGLAGAAAGPGLFALPSQVSGPNMAALLAAIHNPLTDLQARISAGLSGSPSSSPSGSPPSSPTAVKAMRGPFSPTPRLLSALDAGAAADEVDEWRSGCSYSAGGAGSSRGLPSSSLLLTPAVASPDSLSPSASCTSLQLAAPGSAAAVGHPSSSIPSSALTAGPSAVRGATRITATVRMSPKVSPPSPLGGLLKGQAIAQATEQFRGLVQAAARLAAQEEREGAALLQLQQQQAHQARSDTLPVARKPQEPQQHAGQGGVRRSVSSYALRIESDDE